VFSVPVAGLVGWGLFAFSATWLLATLRGAMRWLTVPLSVLATHALLLACWWGALRWVARGALPWTACAAVLAVATGVYTAAVWRRGATLPWRELVPRAVATGFFAVLLAPRVDVPLGVWAALFTPPWLLLCARAAVLAARPHPIQATSARSPVPVRPRRGACRVGRSCSGLHPL
jgi:hypothetical protein